MAKPLKKSMHIDVLDAEDVWNSAIVKDVFRQQVLVSLDGFGCEKDQWLQISSDRIAPVHSYSKAVKCFAKFENLSWWPAIAFLCAPDTEEAKKRLQNETSVWVEFLDDDRFRCRLNVSNIAYYSGLEPIHESLKLDDDFIKAWELFKESSAFALQSNLENSCGLDVVERRINWNMSMYTKNSDEFELKFALNQIDSTSDCSLIKDQSRKSPIYIHDSSSDSECLSESSDEQDCIVRKSSTEYIIIDDSEDDFQKIETTSSGQLSDVKSRLIDQFDEETMDHHSDGVDPSLVSPTNIFIIDGCSEDIGKIRICINPCKSNVSEAIKIHDSINSGKENVLTPNNCYKRCFDCSNDYSYKHKLQKTEIGVHRGQSHLKNCEVGVEGTKKAEVTEVFVEKELIASKRISDLQGNEFEQASVKADICPNETSNVKNPGATPSQEIQNAASICTGLYTLSSFRNEQDVLDGDDDVGDVTCDKSSCVETKELIDKFRSRHIMNLTKQIEETKESTPFYSFCRTNIIVPFGKERENLSGKRYSTKKYLPEFQKFIPVDDSNSPPSVTRLKRINTSGFSIRKWFSKEKTSVELSDSNENSNELRKKLVEQKMNLLIGGELFFMKSTCY